MESKESSICPGCETVAKMEVCIETHPRQAALVSLAGGFLLAQLPLRLLTAGLARIVLWSLKPTAVLYALYRLAEAGYAHRHPEEAAPPSPEE
jgi:hypothetical protein